MIPFPTKPSIPSSATSPLSKTRIIGLAVGLAVADILLVGVCFYFLLCRRRRGRDLTFFGLKKRFAGGNKNSNSKEDVAELRGPPVYAQEREDEDAQHEIYVEASEVQGTVCYHELAARGEDIGGGGQGSR